MSERASKARQRRGAQRATDERLREDVEAPAIEVSRTGRAGGARSSIRVLAVAGFGGGVLAAVASYWVAAIPVFFRHPDTPVISAVRVSSVLPRTAFYVGLAVLLVAWLLLGRLILSDGAEGSARVQWRELRRIALWWAAPFVVAMPIGSRDLWAYAAQGQLVRHGLDPYTLGPSALPGSFADEVSARWVDTPAPYGPLWLTIGRGIAYAVTNVWVSVFVLRLLAVIGVLLLAWALPTLAERAGGRADVALWLGLANPLMLVLGLGGGHNDMLMIGLMAASLVVATGPGSWWRTLGLGTLLATAAVAIKSPAVVALAFLVPLWLHHAPAARSAPWRGKAGIMRATAVVGGGSVALFAGFTALSGLGWGWIKLVNSAAPIVNWMSLPSLLTICWNLLLGVTDGTTRVNATMRGFRTAGTVLSLALLAGAWFVALRRQWWPLLAAALVTVVVLGPTVQPWYFCWALGIVAAIVTGRGPLTWLAAASIALVVMIRPNGTGLQMQPPVLAIMAGAGLLAWVCLRRRDHPSGAAVAGRETHQEAFP